MQTLNFNVEDENIVPSVMDGSEGLTKTPAPKNNLVDDLFSILDKDVPEQKESYLVDDLFASLEREENTPKSDSLLANSIAGVLEGNVTGGLSSWETLATSMVDLGRLFSTDEEGNFHLWQSTPDALGIDKEQWAGMDASDRRVFYTTAKLKEIKDTFNPDEKAKMYMASKVAGWIFTDPLSYLPIVGQSTKARAAIGAGVGAASAAGYSAANEGEVDPAMVATGAVLVGAGVAGLDKMAKGIAKKTANTRLEVLTKTAAKFRAESRDGVAALEKAKMSLGYTDETVQKLLLASGKKIEATVDTIKSKQGASTYLKQMSDKQEAINAGPVRKALHSAKEGIDSFVLPTSEIIRKISPRIHMKMNRMFSTTMDQVSDALTAMHPYNEMLGKMYKNKEFKLAYGAADTPTMQKMMKAQFGDEAVDSAYKTYRKVMDDIYNQQTKIGRKIDYIEGYHPFRVKDYDRLLRNMGEEDVGKLNMLLKKEAQHLHGKNAGVNSLSAEARQKVIERFVTPHVKKGGKITPGSMKERAIAARNEAMLEAYDKPHVANVEYVKRNIEDINKKLLFGKYAKGLESSEVDDVVNSSIQRLVDNEMRAGGLTDRQAQALQKALHEVFIDSKRMPHWASKLARNTTYATTIANPRSALTQFSDIALAGAVNGWDNLFAALHGKYKGVGLSAKEWGFGRHISEELMEKGTANTLMHNAFRWSGFTSVDLLGKTAVINSSMYKYKKLAQLDKTGKLTEKGLRSLYRQFGGALTDKEIKQFAKDIHKVSGHKSASDLVKSVLFADLAKIQPVTIMEMPSWYIRHPNGRIAYTLRTFSIKFLNLLRQEAMKDIRTGHAARGLTRIFGIYMTHVAAETGVEMVKRSFIDLEPEEAAKIDEIAVDKLLSASGVFSRYTGQDTGRPASDVAAKVFPMASVFDPIVTVMQKTAKGEDISDALEGRLARQIPLIGPLIEPWFDTYEAKTRVRGVDY